MPNLRICFCCALLALCTISLYGQTNGILTITGKVYREGTDSVIAGASVYYSGSMAGTITDSKGGFTLVAKQQQVPIIVSCIGYYSVTDSKYAPGQPLIVFLKPKAQELHEVTIRVDGMDRKEEIREFIREFLGTSYYARGCIINNLDDINFYYSKKTQTLTASCDKPIIIANKRLGYTISYYLDKFELKNKDVFISGNSIFKEIPELAGQAIIKRNREDAYEGSRMQFIRALWHYTLHKAGFNMYINGYVPLAEHHILAHDSLQHKYIHLPKEILIMHRNDNRVVNYLTPKADLIFIDKDGYYGAGLSWGGPLGNQRIGDLLPFEYQSKNEQEDLPESAISTTGLTMADKGTVSPLAVKSELIAMPDKFTIPGSKLIFEKTYLHTDRDVYAPGDTLWFKAYLVNAQDNTPANSSGNLYVDLISPEAKIIGSELIRLDGGLGNGDFDLADTLAPGQYRLRAYTNWMRNFGDNFIFEKEITVLGDKVAVAPAVAGKKETAKEVAAGKVAVAAKEVAVKNKQRNTATATATNLTASATATATNSTATLPIIRFYPEGGSMVEGISSLIAFKSDDGFGSGVIASGVVLSAAGDTITRFNCDSLGMGLFTLLPVKGQVYHVLVRFGKNSHEAAFDLPSALSQGLALQVKQIDSLIRAVVSTNIDYTALTVKPAYTLTVKHSGITLLSQQLQLTSQQISVKIPTSNLPEGIAAITLYDETGKPNCERLVYIHPSKTTEKVTISTDKLTYQPKEKVTVNINAPANSNLSMAVVDAGIIPEQADDIVSYLRLQSEVKGNIEHARRYVDTTNVNRFKQLDLLLMTQGWQDFIWRRLADTAIRISYAAENGVNVSGKVEDEVNHKPMPNLNVSLYADAAKGNKIFSSNTDAVGRFNISDLMLYGKQNVKLSSVNDKGEKRGSFIVDTLVPLSMKEKNFLYKEIADTVKTAKLLRYAALSKKEAAGKQLKEVTIKAKAPAFTSTFDKNHVNLDNGGRYLTWGDQQLFNITPKDYWTKTLTWFVEQKFKNVLPNASGPDVLVRIDNSFKRPVLVVNGSTFHNSRILYWDMPIEKFKSVNLVIAVIPPGLELRPYLFLTIKEDALTDNPGRLSLDVQGYYEARTFYKPVYSKGNMPKTDYRTTIHWEPNIKTDAAGKAVVSFYNAVPQADVRVVVQGVTERGVPVATSAVYEVK